MKLRPREVVVIRFDEHYSAALIRVTTMIAYVIISPFRLSGKNKNNNNDTGIER